MARPRVLFVADDEHGFTDERVKRVADHHLKRQTSGGEVIDTRTRSIRRGSGHSTSER